VFVLQLYPYIPDPQYNSS